MEKAIQAGIDHAFAEYPRESCGLIVKSEFDDLYVPCRNVAEGRNHFIVSKDDYVAAMDKYQEIVALVHSHPDQSAEPSEADVVMCETMQIPWLILGVNPGVGGDEPSTRQKWIRPTGYRAPLIGRTFAHGVLDCYSIVRDIYQWELEIELPDFPRHDEWWERGENLYAENFEKANFVKVNDELKKYDVLLMHIGTRSTQPNHAAIYLGDGVILHHLPKRLSMREQYGGYYMLNTTHHLRHSSKC